MPSGRQSQEYLQTRRAAAVEMCKKGESFEDIAKRLDYVNAESAKRDVQIVLAEVLKTPMEESRALDVLRIDSMIAALWGGTQNANPQAVDKAVKLIELRAKLLGTFAPIQVEQVSMDAVEQEIKRLERELGAAARKAVRKSRTVRGAAGGAKEGTGG